MAAPHVAGAFGLLRQAKPAATVDEMVEALRCSGKPINRMFVPGTGPGTGVFEFEPYRRRIDLLGAYNAIKNLPNALRTWSFDKAAEGRDWVPLYGNWTVQSGNYVPTTSRTNGVGAQVSNCHTKVAVTVRVQRKETKTLSGGCPETGIVVRSQSNFYEEHTSGYAAVFTRCPANSAGHCDDRCNQSLGTGSILPDRPAEGVTGVPR